MRRFRRSGNRVYVRQFFQASNISVLATQTTVTDISLLDFEALFGTADKTAKRIVVHKIHWFSDVVVPTANAVSTAYELYEGLFVVTSRSQGMQYTGVSWMQLNMLTTVNNITLAPSRVMMRRACLMSSGNTQPASYSFNWHPRVIRVKRRIEGDEGLWVHLEIANTSANAVTARYQTYAMLAYSITN